MHSLTSAGFRPRVIVYEDELERMGRHVLDRRHLETGGELFGLLTPSGSIVLQLATGPGPGARHAPTSFHQDKAFLQGLFALANDRHALQHLGSWHSHHGLSLAEPSPGDHATMVSALQASALPGFLLVIANLVDADGRPDAEGLPEVRAFLYSRRTVEDPLACEWIVLPGESPVRTSDARIDDTDVTPRTRRASTRPVPQAQGLGARRSERDPALAQALRRVPWALTDSGAAMVAGLVDELGARGLRPTDDGELALDLGDGVALVLGPRDEGELLVAALGAEDCSWVRDVTGAAAGLASRVRDALASREGEAASPVREGALCTSTDRSLDTPLAARSSAATHAAPAEGS